MHSRKAAANSSVGVLPLALAAVDDQARALYAAQNDSKRTSNAAEEHGTASSGIVESSNMIVG
jgi:hypothetical protein